MPFAKSYTITPRYLPKNTLRRSGIPMPRVSFIVAHDSGNPGATAQANVAYYERTKNDIQASAHIFVDDREIIECIPALTGPPEKAWHVRYDVPEDNIRFGADANDVAIAVEYCYGGAIDAQEAYTRYVWTLAAICHRFNLPPDRSIVGHFQLDPSRRTDPVSGLAASGRTYDQLLRDVVLEYAASSESAPTPMKLIRNTSSNKVYAVGADNKKHWIFNEETFRVGRDMGLWGDWGDVEAVFDDGYALGHAILFVGQ